MKRVLACGLVLVLVAVTPATGQKAVHPTVLGFGTESCGKYVAARKASDDLLFSSWLGGFLTALSWSSVSHGDRPFLLGSDQDRRLAWLDNYCGERPSDTFYLASMALYSDLRQRATR